MSKPIIDVYETVAAGDALDWVRTGIVTDYSALKFTKGWGCKGSFSIVVHTDMQGADYLKENRIIKLDSNRIGWIETIEISEKDDKGSSFLTAKGTELKDQVYRWTIPPTGYDTDSYSAKDIEYIVKTMMAKNAGATAAAARQLEGFTLAADQSRGSTINWSTRHKQLLNEVYELLAIDRMGLSCAYDPDAETITYDLEEGVDRKNSQVVNSPITLSTEWKTAKTYHYKKDYTNYRNVVYCGGQGAGKDRTIRLVYDGASEPEGYARRELFVDRRDVEDDNELTDAAEQKLAQTALEVGVKVSFNNYGAYTIDDDFKCGDYITVESDYSSDDAQVIKVIYNYDVLTGYEQIDLVLDFDGDDIERAITARFARYDALISKEPEEGAIGPSSAVDGNIATFDGTDGDTLKDSGKSISDLLKTVYPVGAVYISVVSTSPATLFGGTWSAFGAGKVLVGIDSGDTDFDTVEETGGHKKLQAHTHTNSQKMGTPGINGAGELQQGVNMTSIADIGDTDSTGDGDSENLQPYFVVYMWKRTA